MSGANGVIDHPGGASVEAMDTSDASNSISSRFPVKISTINKQQSNKPMSPGRNRSFALTINDLFSTVKPIFYI